MSIKKSKFKVFNCWTFSQVVRKQDGKIGLESWTIIENNNSTVDSIFIDTNKKQQSLEIK